MSAVQLRPRAPFLLKIPRHTACGAERIAAYHAEIDLTDGRGTHDHIRSHHHWRRAGRLCRGDKFVRGKSVGKRILVVLGHTNSASFCAALADAYMQGAISAGHHVRFISLAAITFNPSLVGGYKGGQTLETCLVDAQRDITWAEHLVFVYPVWWGAMPAILKGFIDRVFLPGFAFKYRDNSVASWDKLLTGRSAHVIVTMDSPPWYYRWMTRMPGHNQMRHAILEYCGIKPVKISSIGSIKGSTAQQREQWIAQVNKYGRAL